MLVNVTPVAWSVPHDPIEGFEQSAETQTALAELFGIFRHALKEPTGFVNKYNDSVITFNDATRTFSIAPLSTSYRVFVYAKLFVKTTTESIQIPATDNEGLWFFYFDSSGVLQCSLTPWDLRNAIAPISTGYWDSTNGKWITENEERHGVVMDADTHRRMHLADGSKIGTDINELAIINFDINGDGSLDSHAQFGITDGTYFDEDISIDIMHSDTPSNYFEQVLRPYAKIPVFYLDGDNNWRKKEATFYPLIENGPSTAKYNFFNGSVWSLVPCTNDWFFAIWLVYSDDLMQPVAAILGQRQDEDLISAVNNNTKADLKLPRRFSAELFFYKKLIFQTNTSYLNTPKARLRFVATINEITPASDRYLAISSYGGNAGSGRYLEFYPGKGSDTAPLPIPETSYLRIAVFQAVSPSTGVIGIYKITDLVNPIFTMTLTNSVYQRYVLTIPLLAGDKLAVKIISGAFSKPDVSLWPQTSL